SAAGWWQREGPSPWPLRRAMWPPRRQGGCHGGHVCCPVARAAAGRSVGVFGANTARQVLDDGLLDEIVVRAAPVLLGDGVGRTAGRSGGMGVAHRTHAIQTSPPPSVIVSQPRK